MNRNKGGIRRPKRTHQDATEEAIDITMALSDKPDNRKARFDPRHPTMLLQPEVSGEGEDEEDEVDLQYDIGDRKPSRRRGVDLEVWNLFCMCF